MIVFAAFEALTTTGAVTGASVVGVASNANREIIAWIERGRSAEVIRLGDFRHILHARERAVLPVRRCCLGRR